MSVIRLYVDEDAMDEEVLLAICSRGVDAISVAEAGMLRQIGRAHV